MIIAVVGPPGVGKTHWIKDRIDKNRDRSSYYLEPKTDSVPIDSIALVSQFPDLTILATGGESNLLTKTETNFAYIEIPWYLDLYGIEPFLQQLNCHRVAILPLDWQNTGLNAWADEVIPGNSYQIKSNSKNSLSDRLEVHRGVMTGEILDFASLETFWQELTGGAYGEVIRAKAIFDTIEGESIYRDFVENVQKDWQTLNFPRCLDGKPQRFSGFEIVGQNLNKEEIGQTVRDCCLSEAAIAHYQKQIKESLGIEEEVSV
ncbi:MAG: GTP-binding protein [Xenococcaceae cyanobacterium]